MCRGHVAPPGYLRVPPSPRPPLTPALSHSLPFLSSPAAAPLPSFASNTSAFPLPLYSFPCCTPFSPTSSAIAIYHVIHNGSKQSCPLAVFSDNQGACPRLSAWNKCDLCHLTTNCTVVSMGSVIYNSDVTMFCS